MPRGGRREGAGRRRLLTWEQSISIGAHCERLWRQAVDEKTNALLAKRTERTQKQKAKAKRIPVPKRKAWQASDDCQDYRDDVRGAMQEDQGIDAVEDDRDPERLIHIPVKRPKDKQDEIKAKVAAEHGVSLRMVTTCWERFRRFEREVDRRFERETDENGPAE